MQGDYWIARNPAELQARVAGFCRQLEQQAIFPICWQAKPYTNPRSLDQNALYWVWVTEFAQHLLNKKKISAAEKEDMAYTLQRHCYAAMGWDWLLTTPVDLLTGKPGKPQRKSTTKMLKGEMTLYLEWVQSAAADRGLILESVGEYAELQASQNA